MKKWIAMMLALALLVGLAVPAMAENATLFSWEGYSVQLLNYKVYKSPGSAASLRLRVRIVNDTDRTLSLWLNDATIGGVSVVVAPILGVEARADTGTDDPEEFYVFAAKENKDTASDAIASAGELQGTFLLRDSDTGEELISQAATIDIAAADGVRIINTPKPTATPTPKPTATPSPNATSTYSGSVPPYTPASYDFQTLQKGSKGQAVRDLQQRLTDLGYLNDKVDGVFGLNTATAVMSFNAQNGFYINGTATPEMQSLLYSSSAQHYVEPWIPMIIGPEYKWDNPSRGQDIGWFYVQLVNRCNRTVRGYELYYYMTDVWGKKITVGSNNAWLYPITHQQTIQPGYLVYDKAGFAVTPFANTYSVYVGVHKIVFDDGEIREVSDDEVQYFECPVKK